MNKEYVKGLIDMAICAVSEYELPGDDSGLTFHVESSQIVAYWAIGSEVTFAGNYDQPSESEPVLRSDCLDFAGLNPEKLTKEAYLFVESCIKLSNQN